MDGWKTLRKAIPDGAAKAVANRLNVSPDHVRRWRREPLSDDAPMASGQRSPLDRVRDLLDAIFLTHPAGAVLIVEHVRAHHDELVNAALDLDHWDKHKAAARTLRETVEAVNALNLNTADDETLQEFVEARDELDQVITTLRARRGLGGRPRQDSETVGSGREAGSGGGPRA